MRAPINDYLNKVSREGNYPFHMPGHKRKGFGLCSRAMNYDITEISGADNLHHPEGIIRESMNLLSRIYASRKSWYLVGGSSLGILASIGSVCHAGDTIIIARNCHQAVYHAIDIFRLHAFYVEPDYDRESHIALSLNPERIRKALENYPEAKAVVVTSPTYEGVVSDIRRISEITAAQGSLLIVDEAHGAHFPFSSDFPESAVNCGADLVVQSIHKTLPSMTQTALLHLCSSRVDPEAVSERLRMLETSSPSYILLASAEMAVLSLYENPQRMADYAQRIQKFREKCGKLTGIKLFYPQYNEAGGYDCGKLVFFCRGYGDYLFRRLAEDYRIESEMRTADYVLLMTSVADEDEDFDRLLAALYDLDACIGREGSVREKRDTPDGSEGFTAEKVFPAWACREKEKEKVALEQSCGRICADYVFLYPPGIPLLVPGEKISEEILEKISSYLYNGFDVNGTDKGMIRVISGVEK